MALARFAPSRRPQLVRLLKAFVAALCVVGVGWGFTLHRDTPSTVIDRGVVETVTPSDNAPVVPAQSTVSADLQYGYTGVLQIRGTEIPLDQTDVIVAQGIVSFTPGPDKEFRKLPGGYVDATIVYWPATGTREDDAREYTWHFTVN